MTTTKKPAVAVAEPAELRITQFPLAAALAMRKIPFRASRTDAGQMSFLFERTPECERIVTSFMGGVFEANVCEFLDMMNALKDRAFGRGAPPPQRTNAQVEPARTSRD